MRISLSIIVFSLPFSWLIAFLLSIHSSLIAFAVPIFVSLLVGVGVGGVLVDIVKNRTNLLLGYGVVPLAIGVFMLWDLVSLLVSQYLMIVTILLFFILGGGIVIFTIFLNQVVPCTQRGRAAGLATIISLGLGGFLPILWRNITVAQPLIPGITALAFLIGLIIVAVVKPWTKELRTYMVPGAVRPYAFWWAIYVVAYALYSLSTPLAARIIFVHSNFQGINVLWAEIALIGVGGAAGAFSLLPDRLGRKRVFTIASLLLAELCLFGNGRATGLPSVIIALTIGELFVIGFIVGVGSWLIWSEIGPVRLKGRRASLGWLLVAAIGVGLWISTTSPLWSYAFLFPELVYPIAATLLFVSIIPLTNATEVIWNERIIESLEIRVDSEQVSKAIQELEIDTPLESIQQQIQSEVTELAKIQGVTKTKAKRLRDQGYESIVLVAQSEPQILAQVLGISKEEAAKIKASAEKLVASRERQSVRDDARAASNATEAPKDD